MIWVGVLDEPCVVTASDGPVPAAGVLSNGQPSFHFAIVVVYMRVLHTTDLEPRHWPFCLLTSREDINAEKKSINDELGIICTVCVLYTNWYCQLGLQPRTSISTSASTKSSSNNLDISAMEALSPWYTEYAVRCIPPSSKPSVPRPTRLSRSPQPSTRPENFAPTTHLRVPPPRPSNFLCGIRHPTATPPQTPIMHDAIIKQHSNDALPNLL